MIKIGSVEQRRGSKTIFKFFKDIFNLFLKYHLFLFYKVKININIRADY